MSCEGVKSSLSEFPSFLTSALINGRRDDEGEEAKVDREASAL